MGCGKCSQSLFHYIQNALTGEPGANEQVFAEKLFAVLMDEESTFRDSFNETIL
jgi:hypothetical protein